jgi:hypothetical protein
MRPLAHFLSTTLSGISFSNIFRPRRANFVRTSDGSQDELQLTVKVIPDCACTYTPIHAQQVTIFTRI